MTALDDTPTNPNFLNPLNFQFQLKRAPHINFFVQKVNMPSLRLAQIPVASPLFPIPKSGKIEFGEFSITFKVDEDLQNYLELYSWMIDLGFPENFQQYASLASQPEYTGNGLYSDITLLILDSTQSPNYVLSIRDAFPISLSDVIMDATNPEVVYTTATATFKYLNLKLEKYNT